MRNYVMSTKLTLLEERSEENLEAVNDLSEDMSHEIDNIYDKKVTTIRYYLLCRLQVKHRSVSAFCQLIKQIQISP